MIVSGTYDPWLVGLSILVAVLASDAALDLAGPLAVVNGRARAVGLGASAVAAGGAVWSMHFIGMLAFEMPMPVRYHLGITLASLAVPIAAAGLGLLIVARDRPTWRRLAGGGLLIGLGVVAMHHLGMAGLEMAAVIAYDPPLVGASILIAVGAATAALWIASRRRSTARRITAAGALGGAIAGMHYTGVAAATFVVAPGRPAPWFPVLAPPLLAVVVAATTLIILFLALVASQIGRRRLALDAERRLTDVAANFPGVIYRHEMRPDGRITCPYASKGVPWLLDLRADEATSRLGLQDLWRMLPPDERARWRQALQQSAETLEPFFFESSIRLPDGAVRWARSQASTHRRRDGTVVWDGVVLDVTATKRAEEQLQASLAEKEMLLEEVDHRVRNNLQVIVSLMRLDAGVVQDPEARERLERIIGRVRALGRVHEQSYRFGDFGRIDIARYLEELCAGLAELHGPAAGVTIDVGAEPLRCDLQTAIPLGLIANELITNSLKHAFPAGREGRIAVTVRRTDDAVELAVADNGVGARGPAGPPGFGQRLIDALVHQLDGALRHGPGSGTRVTLAIAGARFAEHTATEPPAEPDGGLRRAGGAIG